MATTIITATMVMARTRAKLNMMAMLPVGGYLRMGNLQLDNLQMDNL